MQCFQIFGEGANAPYAPFLVARLNPGLWKIF